MGALGAIGGHPGHVSTKLPSYFRREQAVKLEEIEQAAAKGTLYWLGTSPNAIAGQKRKAGPIADFLFTPSLTRPRTHSLQSLALYVH